MKNLKFRVNSEEHSKAIQTRLIELGYSLRDYEDYKTKKESFMFIYAYEGNGTIHYGRHESAYLANQSLESTIDDLYYATEEKVIQLSDDLEAKIVDGKLVLIYKELSVMDGDFDKVFELVELIEKEKNK